VVPGGWLIIEISPMLEQRARETLAAAGNWTEPRLVKDLAGLARVVTCRRKTAE